MDNKFMGLLKADRKARVMATAKNLALLEEKETISIVYYQLLPICRELSDAVCLVDDNYLTGYALLVLSQQKLIEGLGAILEAYDAVKKNEFVTESLKFLAEVHDSMAAHYKEAVKAKHANDIRANGQKIVDQIGQRLQQIQESASK